MTLLKTVLVTLAFSVLFYFSKPLSVHAQNNELIIENVSKVLFKGNFFGFYINPYVAQKANCKSYTGAYSLKALNSWGIEAGGIYFINFNKSYSLIVGAHAGFSGRNFKLFISKSDFTPALKDDIDLGKRETMDFALYLSAPLWFEKRWFGKNNSSWNIDAGINVRFNPDEAIYFYDYGGSDVNDQFVPVLQMEGWSGNNLKPWLNYNVGGGYSWFLPNYNFIRINLIANFSATRVINFDYTIDVQGKPQSSGTYSSTLSNVGISLSYILTGANKRLVKYYRKMK